MILLLPLLGLPVTGAATLSLLAELRVPRRLADAAAQVAAAQDRYREARAARGAARLLAMEAAVRAYRAVEVHWPEDAARRAEAAWRRGQLERALDRPGRARAAFEAVLDAGAEPDWAARARLELASLCEAGGEFEAALELLAAVRVAPRISVRWRNRARQRTAELRLAGGDWARARAAARCWSAEASDSVEQVRAADLEARALLGAGRAADAARVLTRLAARMQPLAALPGEDAAALRRALERMQAPGALSDSRPRPPP